MSANLYFGAFLNYFYNNLLTHFPSHFIRKSFLRIFNRRIHPSSVILMHSRLLNFWNIEIGPRVVINQYCLLDCRKYPITIGSDTDIGPYTRIWTLGHAPDSPMHDLYGGQVTIGHHVWIASGVTILPAVSLGPGAVIAAAAVVHKSVDSMHIVGGNPARFIRLRENPLTYTLNYNPLFE
jgi:putative colanic acid biosynthesis acetyltransferase WcaF